MHLISRRRFVAGTSAVVGLSSMPWLPLRSDAATSIHPIPDVDGRFIRTVDQVKKLQSIYAFNLDLSDNLVPKDLDFQVYAYSVFVSGQLKSAGRSIKIVCNDLYVDQGTLIDLRGPDPFPDFKGQAAQNGQAPGQNGSNGANGGTGPSAGNLAIVCNSISGKLTVNGAGQPGGAAQSGGNGADGQAGGNNPALGSTGGAGQAGGVAGRAGAPGQGGNGGKIIIVTAEAFAPSQLVADVSAGPPGALGAHGRPGRGGPGGVGASGRECHWEMP